MTASPTPLFAEGSGAVPSEEEFVKLAVGWMKEGRYVASEAVAKRIYALFAPILAEREREYELASEGRAAFAARALAAEAALAGERERVLALVEDACATPTPDFAGMELDAFHRGADAMNEAIAAAIRKGSGE